MAERQLTSTRFLSPVKPAAEDKKDNPKATQDAAPSPTDAPNSPAPDVAPSTPAEPSAEPEAAEAQTPTAVEAGAQ